MYTQLSYGKVFNITESISILCVLSLNSYQQCCFIIICVVLIISVHIITTSDNI